MRYRHALALLVAVVLASPAWAKRHPVTTLAVEADLCRRICQFSLCIGEGNRPMVTLCTPEQANMTVLVQHENDSPMRLKVRRTTVALDCRADILAPCTPSCTSDADCEPNLAPSFCREFTCTAEPRCPPR